jgi:hypothetical protein
MGKTETISSKVRNETEVSTLPTLIQHSTWTPSQSNKAREKIKWMQIGKKEIKLSLFFDDKILFLKTLKTLQKKPKSPGADKPFWQSNRI